VRVLDRSSHKQLKDLQAKGGRFGMSRRGTLGMLGASELTLPHSCVVVRVLQEIGEQTAWLGQLFRRC